MRAAGEIGATKALARSHAEASPFNFRAAVARHSLPYALIAPALLVILGVLGWPLVMLVWLSLQHYGLRELFQHQGTFVGLKNFSTILADPQFAYTLRTTIIFTVVNVDLSMWVSSSSGPHRSYRPSTSGSGCSTTSSVS